MSETLTMPRCPWCSREFDEWRDAKRHVKSCDSAPRPRSHVESERALRRMIEEIRKLARYASPEEIAALRTIAVRAEEQHLSVAGFLREIVGEAGQQHRVNSNGMTVFGYGARR
jgi:hypothetical protein